MSIHWSGRNTKDYVFRLALDFISQLDKKMDAIQLSQGALAKKLKVSKGRVSQLFNDPGNIELETIVKYSKALNMKVGIVAYEDDDPKNRKGPIDPEIFKVCWERLGKPREFWDLQKVVKEEHKQTLKLAIPDLRSYKEIGSTQDSSIVGRHISEDHIAANTANALILLQRVASQA